MVVLNKIYTKTGDAGETALGNGSRVAKHSLRVTAYGTTVELIATVGMARLDAEGELDKLLSLIQNDLFDLGADLCRPEMENDKDAEYPPLRIIDAQVDRLEAEIDVMNDKLEPLRSFVLPGGSAWRPKTRAPHGCTARGTFVRRVGHDGRDQSSREISKPSVRLVFCCRSDCQ